MDTLEAYVERELLRPRGGPPDSSRTVRAAKAAIGWDHDLATAEGQGKQVSTNVLHIGSAVIPAECICQAMKVMMLL
jgi:hypothetical protein